MKIEPVPTSPKVRKKEKVVKEIYSQGDSKSFDKPPAKSKNGLVVIILAIFAGFLAGLFGEVIINALAISYPNLPLISELYLSNSSDQSRIIIQRSEKSLSALEFEMQQTLRNTRPMVVKIFEKAKDNKQDPLDQIYYSENAKGNAIILTNDGLVMTSSQVIDDISKDYIALTADKKIYPLRDILVDPTSGVVFFRIEANNLTIAQFVDPMDLKISQQLMSVINKTDGSYEMVSAEMRDLYYRDNPFESDLIFSSEIFANRFQLTNILPEEFKGAPIITVDGKVVGIAVKFKQGETKTQLVLPAQQFRLIIPRVIKNNEVGRVLLGVHYLELSKVTNIAEDLSQGLDKGALIYGDDILNLPAVENGSPAQKAGLEAGDIIIKVDDQELNFDNDLAELVQERKIGEKIQLTVLAAGKEKTVNIELAELVK